MLTGSSPTAIHRRPSRRDGLECDQRTTQRTAGSCQVDLNPIVSVQNPFDAVERILRGVIQTQINDWLAVEALLVEQLGHISINRFLAVLAPVPLDRNGNLLKAVLC